MILQKPWGLIRAYVLNQTCTVKLIEILPGEATSLHFHRLRDDMWIMLDDGLKVQVGEEIREPKAGDEIIIPAGQLHKIIGGDKAGRVLEIDFGYSSEDDHHRVADDYGRRTEEIELS